MINKGIKTAFPSQAVSDVEKMTLEYGSKVGKAIEHEWFNNSGSYNRHGKFKESFHNLRLYARGCLLYTSPSPRDRQKSRMPSSA